MEHFYNDNFWSEYYIKNILTGNREKKLKLILKWKAHMASIIHCLISYQNMTNLIYSKDVEVVSPQHSLLSWNGSIQCEGELMKDPYVFLLMGNYFFEHQVITKGFSKFVEEASSRIKISGLHSALPFISCMI